MIGGGIAGIQSALDLARAGFQVHLIERTSSSENLERTLEQRSVASELVRMLETLPPNKRIPFYLHHVEGASAQEIAEILGESRDAILKRLQRTRAELEEMWTRRESRSKREGTP